MRVVVHGRLRYASDKPQLEQIVTQIGLMFEQVQFTTSLAASIDLDPETIIHPTEIPKGDLDVMISVGGDGTLLDSVRIVGRSGIPILGVNTGRLGFLASTPFEELEQALLKLRNGDFHVEARSLVQADTDSDLFGTGNFALNEVSVHKSATSSMLIVKAYLDDFFLNTYWADGLIISTPTGSTGYSLSTGGPIVSPETNNIIISPIAPHNLNVRPLVVSDTRSITLRIEDTDPQFMVSLDSQSRIVSSDVEIRISKADFTIGLIRFRPNEYFDTLRSKLMWGHDLRN